MFSLSPSGSSKTPAFFTATLMLHHLPAGPFPSPFPGKVWQKRLSNGFRNDVSSPVCVSPLPSCFHLSTAITSAPSFPRDPLCPSGLASQPLCTTQSIYLHAPHFKTEATLNLMRLPKCLHFSTHLVRLRPTVLSLREIRGTKSPRSHTPRPQLGWGKGMYICIHILK